MAIVITQLLHIHILGGFRVTLGNLPVSSLTSLRLQSLLAFLIIYRFTMISRAHIASQFWPESSEPQGRANLRQLLHRLYASLPGLDHHLQADAHSLQWRPERIPDSDVGAFEAAYHRASQNEADLEQLRDAVDCYTGDLLPACYDEWILLERERLRLRYLDLLSRLSARLGDAGNYRDAIQYTQKLLQCDPVREENYRQLIHLYLAVDDPAAALHTYYACATILERELGVSPGPATQRLYERLVSPELHASFPAPAFPTTLVGRRKEWERMHSAWKQAGMGRAHLVMIEGEAGIGKTRLAEEIASLALRQEAHVAAAGCYQAERDLAYAPLVSWLRAAPLPPLDPMWLSEIARLLPEAQTLHPELPASAPLTDEWQRQRLFDALAHALLDRPRPSLLILDDAQWCDRQTLEWLHYLLRSHPRARLLVVATVRSEDLEPFSPFASLLSGLRRRQQLVEIGLGPLSLEESTELAIQAVEQSIQLDDAAVLYRYTEGNPLFIIEMSRAGWLTAGHATPEVTAIPLTLQSVIAERLAQLSVSTRQLMELAAVIGREFSFPLLQSSSDMPDEALLVALDELWLRRIVRERGPDAYDFSHALLRQTAYAGISPMRRRLLHLRVARSWEALHESASPAAIIQAAYHYDQAQDWQAAVRAYQLACVTAHQLYANSESIACSDRALEILETQVQRCTQEADKHPLWRTQAEVLLERAWNWMLFGNMGTNQIDLDRLLILAEKLQDVTINAQVIYRQALVDYHYCRFPSAREAAFRSAQLNQQTGNRREEGRALQLVGRIDMAVGDFENAAAHLLSARRIFIAIGDPVLEVHTLSHLSTTYLYAGQPALAMEIAREALALCQQPNPLLVHRERIPLGDMGAAAIELGDYEKADAWLEQSLELARRVRDNHQEAFCLGHLGWMRLSRGLAGEAYPLLSQALEISLASDLHIYRSWLLAGLAEFHILCGDLQSARQTAHQSLELARRFTLAADLKRAEALTARLDYQA